MTKLLIRSACAAPLLAWCCCALGMSCARRSKVRARWRREVPDELHELATELPPTRSAGASRRDDLHAVPRAATRTHTRAGSLRAHAGLRHLPHVAARDGPRIASAHTRHAGRRRALARAHRRFPATRAPLHAMDLDGGVWTRSHRRVRHVHQLYRAVGTTPRTSRIRGDKFAELTHFSRIFLEGVAVDDFTGGDFGPGYSGRICGLGRAQTLSSRIGAGSGADRTLRVICVLSSCPRHLL